MVLILFVVRLLLRDQPRRSNPISKIKNKGMDETVDLVSELRLYFRWIK